VDVFLDVVVASSRGRGIDVLLRSLRRFGTVIMRVACTDCRYGCLKLRSLECLRRSFVVFVVVIVGVCSADLLLSNSCCCLVFFTEGGTSMILNLPKMPSSVKQL
jgi:hypothetical protein